jgi:hypothetical protein
MVGYQGVSSRPRSQRQSGANGRSVHTGLPRAPARWAAAVSTVITRSRPATSPATPRKSRRSDSWSTSATGEPSIWRAASPPCKLCRTTPGTAASVENAPSGTERRRSFRFWGWPAQTSPTLNAGAPRGQPGPPARRLLGVRRHVRNLGGDGLDRGSEDPRQAQERRLQLEGRQLGAVGHDLVDPGHRKGSIASACRPSW